MSMKTKDITLCALFVVLISVGAFVKIPIPFVPITLQTTFVCMAGLLLGARLGALSCLIYLVLGLVGVPIFALGGGIGYVLQPSFGYIIGFVFGAFVTGKIAYAGTSQPSIKRMVVSFAAGLGVIYLFGMVYLFCIKALYLGQATDFWFVLWYGMVIFLPGDILCNLAGALLAHRILPFSQSANVRKAKAKS